MNNDQQSNLLIRWGEAMIQACQDAEARVVDRVMRPRKHFDLNTTAGRARQALSVALAPYALIGCQIGKVYGQTFRGAGQLYARVTSYSLD